MKYSVLVKYTGILEFIVEASNGQEATVKAREAFYTLDGPDGELSEILLPEPMDDD